MSVEENNRRVKQFWKEKRRRVIFKKTSFLSLGLLLLLIFLHVFSWHELFPKALNFVLILISIFSFGGIFTLSILFLLNLLNNTKILIKVLWSLSYAILIPMIFLFNNLKRSDYDLIVESEIPGSFKTIYVTKYYSGYFVKPGIRIYLHRSGRLLMERKWAMARSNLENITHYDGYSIINVKYTKRGLFSYSEKKYVLKMDYLTNELEELDTLPDL